MENFHLIKEKLREVLGVEAAGRCTDRQIRRLWETFQSRPDSVECVVQSLVEQSFERGESFGDTEEVVTDEGFVFLETDQELICTPVVCRGEV